MRHREAPSRRRPAGRRVHGYPVGGETPDAALVNDLRRDAGEAGFDGLLGRQPIYEIARYVVRRTDATRFKDSILCHECG